MELRSIRLCGCDSAAQTAITEGNFVPTLVEWLSEGITVALESHAEGGDAVAAATAAEFYEGSARALRRLQPAEAQAGGVDVDKIAANYMLQAVVGYSSGENLFAAAKALVQVTAADADSGRRHNYGVVLDLGCDAAVKLLTVGLTVLQSEVLTRPIVRTDVGGQEHAALHEAVKEAMVVVGGSARRCSLGPALEQRLQVLNMN